MNRIKQILLYCFSVYLIVLMALPCSEAHASNGSIAMEQSGHSKEKDNDDDHHQMEICTPFCICSSCVIAIVVHPALDIQFFDTENTTTEISNFYTSFKSDFYGAIWQPPQLV